MRANVFCAGKGSGTRTAVVCRWRLSLAERIREALAVPGRPGIRVIKQFGVSPMTVQNVSRA